MYSPFGPTTITTEQVKTKQQSMFAFVGKKNLTESFVSERPDKTPKVNSLGSKKTSYDAVSIRC